MALLSPTSAHQTRSPNSFTDSTFFRLRSTSATLAFSPIHLRRPSLSVFSNPNPCPGPPGRCHVASPRPPSPPESDPPPQKGSIQLTATLSRFQDRVQIFFAVLFWMSLFFWASAWSGRNNDRPNKGSRFRR